MQFYNKKLKLFNAIMVGTLGVAVSLSAGASTSVDKVSIKKVVTSNGNVTNRQYVYDRIQNKRQPNITVNGVPVTGANQYCGQQRWTFDDQDIQVFSFRQVARYAPGQEFPEVLTPYNCEDDAILASTHDPQLSFDPPGPPGPITSAPDSRLENIPLRDVPKNAGILQGGTAGIRNFIEKPAQVPVNPFPVVQASGSDPITLGDWSKATGKMNFRCKADGSATVTVRMRNLVPNGVYSMWGIWKTPLPIGIFVDLPVPFGGLPNAIVPDDRGNAVFKRDLAFCPSSPTGDGSQLLWVTAAYHSDGSLYGGVPDAANVKPTFVDAFGDVFESTLSLMVHHEHLAFPVNFTEDLLAD